MIGNFGNVGKRQIEWDIVLLGSAKITSNCKGELVFLEFNIMFLFILAEINE